MAKQLPHMDYEYLRAKIGTRSEAKIAPNTTASLQAGGSIVVRLHGNTIAVLFSTGRVFLDDAGWPTPTTVRRLRALVPAGYTAYLHGGYVWVARVGAKDGGLPIIGGVNLTSDSR